MGKAQDAFINMLREMGAQVINMSDPKAKSEARNKNDQKVDYEELFAHLGLTFAIWDPACSQVLSTSRART